MELWISWPTKFDTSIFTHGMALLSGTFDPDKGGLAAENVQGYFVAKFLLKKNPSPSPIVFGAGPLTESEIRSAMTDCDQCGGLHASLTAPAWLLTALKIAKAILAFLESQLGS